MKLKVSWLRLNKTKVTADNQLTSFQQSLEATKASIAQAEKDVTVKKDLLDAAKKQQRNFQN